MSYLQRIPLISPNDDQVLVGEWLKSENEYVEKGEVIAILETSKVAAEIEAEASGYFVPLVEAGTQTVVGQVYAIIKDSISENIAEALAIMREEQALEKSRGEFCDERGWTIKAELLATRHGIDISEVPSDGRVSERDVLDYLDSKRGRTNLIPDVSQYETIPEGSVMDSAGQILIYGGGGHAKTCIDIIRRTGGYRIHGIIDERLEAGSSVLGVPVLGSDRDLVLLMSRGLRMVVNGRATPNNHPVREAVFKKLKALGFLLPNLIHPQAAVEPSVTMGDGNHIMANASVGSSVKIGNNCIIDAGAVVSNDSRLSDNVHVAPGALLASHVNVGRNTLIGMGSTVYMRVSIGNDVIISNGSNIVRSVPDGATA